MKLLPTPALRSSQAVPIPSDRDVLIRQLMEAICPPTLVAQQQSASTELETLLLNWLPVGIVTEENATSPDPPTDPTEGCFSCGDLTHTTDPCRTLDEQAEHIGDQFILGPGPPASPQGQQMGNADRSGERGWSRGSVMTTDPTPCCWEGHSKTGGPVSCGDCPVVRDSDRTRSVGCVVSRPYSDSDESDNDVLYTDDHDSTVQQVSLRNNWLTPTAVDSCGERCAQLDDFNWFLPADERTGDLPAPESEIEVSDRESEVEYIEPDSIPLQTEMMVRQLLCPLVVAQTRPMEGCDPALPRRLRRGRDVLTEDGAVTVDTEEGVRSF